MAYSKVGISIPKVTGAINIMVSTVAKAVKNLFNVEEAILNKRFSSSGTSSANGTYITGYIDATPGDIIYVKPGVLPSSNNYNKVNCYDSTSDTKLGAKVLATFEDESSILFNVENGVGRFTVPEVSGTTRIKIALNFNTTQTAITEEDLTNVVITKNEPIS